MCNAHNHPPGCTCGFGSDGHLGLGGGGIGYGSLIGFSSSFQTSESFTNPNAHCPVCGAPVFFYRSPVGGRVFFDELGPPWPKHPCTDNVPLSWTPTPVVAPGRRRYAWQEDGWVPLFGVTITEIWRGFYQFRSMGRSIMHFVCDDPDRVDPRPPLVFFRARAGKVSISMFSPSRGTAEFCSVAGPVVTPYLVRLEKVRSNAYRFSLGEDGTSGFFRSNSARLHKPQPVHAAIARGTPLIDLWWADSDRRSFAFFASVDEALASNSPA